MARTKNPFCPLGFKTMTWMTRICSCISVLLLLYGCAGPNSLLLYRLPYADGTDVSVWQDHLTHSGSNPKLDLKGINDASPYRVVAAQTGMVQCIVDNLTENCCNGTCGNNYVWIEHLGGEWTKYSHLATGSVRGDAGLKEGDVVVAGTFLGFESNVGRACGSGQGVHLHFEVGVPNDQTDPLDKVDPGGGFIEGVNRIPRICRVQGQILVQGRNETASECFTPSCIRSLQSPATFGNCNAGLSGDVCVQEINNVELTSTYTRGEDFSSSSVKIDLDWCPNANCDTTGNFGQAIEVVVIHEGDANPTQFIANCQNRRVRETVHNVQQIIIQEAPNFSDENIECNGNEAPSAFAKWEICEVPTSLRSLPKADCRSQ